MLPPTRHPGRDRRARLRAIFGAGAVLAAVVAGGLATSAIAERAKELGKTRHSPPPSCSGEASSECQITGQVTGFQRSSDGKGALFKAPANGRIVAWSIDLASPSAEERNVFGEAAATEAFGESPTAGISILRKKDRGVFRLQRASPILKVASHYGERPTFTLRDPLKVRDGNVVALTTATWLPAFAFQGQDNGDVWVASRPEKDCEVPASVPAEERLEYFFAHTRPHRKVGTERKYACEYERARILYWAYFVPNN